MADQQTELAIVIEAVNKASAQLKQVEKDLDGLNNTTKEQGKGAEKSGIQFGSLVGAIATGSIIATAATKAIEFLTGAVKDLEKYLEDSINVAAEYNRSLTGLTRISQRFGESQDEATISARELASDGLITLSTAAEGLQKLMQGGLSLDQATELMADYKNEAAFGRSSTIEYDQAVRNLSESFYTENSMIGNLSGQTENWNILIERGAELMGKKVTELSKADRAQAKYLAQQELSLLTEGDAIEYADTYLGQLSRLQNAHKELKDTIGNLFLPALKEVILAQGGIIESVNKWAKNNEDKFRAIVERVAEFTRKVIAFGKELIEGMPWGWLVAIVNELIKNFIALGQTMKIVGNIVQAMARGFVVAANSLGALGTAVNQFIKGDFEGLKNTYNEWEDQTVQSGERILNDFGQVFEGIGGLMSTNEFDLKDWWNEIEGIDRAGFDSKLDAIDRYGDELSQKQKDTLKKMQRDIEKANRDYQKAVEKRQKSFEQSLEDLVISHRDSIQSLTDDLASENRDYQKTLSELLKDYNNAMGDIEKRHEEKTASVLEDMADERKKTLEEIEEITEAYNQERSLIEKEGQDRLTSLQVQLDRELALGDNANQTKIDALKQMIAYEKEGLKSSLDDKQAVYDEEVSDVNEKLNEKLAKLKESLDSEDQAYQESFDERKLQYEEDVAEAKASYIEKREALQTELDKEVEIRERYAEDFNRIGDKIAEDDITRLISTFNTEKAEMEREHQERLADIEYQAFKGGESFNDKLASGLQSSYPQVQQQLSQVESDMDRVINKGNEILNGGGWGDSSNWIASSIGGGGGGGSGGGGAFARGGLATQPSIAGENGPEIILPLNFPKRMAQIIQSMGLGGGGGQVTQNFYVTVNNRQDVDVLMERAGFAMQQGGLA
jgi:hypothetical protein